MRGILSRLRGPDREFVALLERARVTSGPRWRDIKETGGEQVSMWQFFLRAPIWVVTSGRGEVSSFELGGRSTGMAAFDEQVLRDWWGSDPSLDGAGFTRVSVPHFCLTMWSLEADCVAVRVDPRVHDAFFDVCGDDLAWLAAGLVPWYRVIGQAPLNDPRKAGLVSAVAGVAGLDAVRLVLTSSSDHTGPCLELVVSEDMPARDRVAIGETVRERLEAQPHEVHQVALVVHGDHIELPEEIAGWPVPLE
jgi:hypothetical protein